MQLIAIRPKSKRKRKGAKIALYSAAFEIGESRRHNSSFSEFCKNDCGYKNPTCSIECNEQGELGRLLYIWRQNGYLIRYFKNQQRKLSERYGPDIRGAIDRNNQLLDEIEERLLKKDISSFFIPLYNRNPDGKVFHPELKFKSKYYCEDFENWIRFYAVKFTDEETQTDNYIITGGSIKLVGVMSEYAPIEYEESKQDAVIQYLIDQEITTRDKIEKITI